MPRTINGKTISQVLEELAADYPSEDIETREYDNVKYISHETLRQRLDTVIGVDHYNEHYPCVEVVESGKTIGIKCNGILEILDDDYDIVFVKEAVGGSTITFPKMQDANGKQLKDANGEAIYSAYTTSFANDCEQAAIDAFKRICKKLHMTRQLQEMSKPVPKLVKFKRRATFTDKNMLFTDIELDGKQIRFAVFSRQASAFKQKFSEIKGGEEVYCFGSEGKDNKGNAQFIFSSFAQAPAGANNANSLKTDLNSTTTKASVEQTLTFVTRGDSAVKKNGNKTFIVIPAIIKGTQTPTNLYFEEKDKNCYSNWDQLEAAFKNGVELPIVVQENKGSYLFVRCA